MEVTSARAQKNLVILKFKGYDNINDIEKYRGMGLYVKKKDRVPLGKDEYFIADLIGCDVISDEKEELGKIGDVIKTGANDVYIIQKEGQKDILVPAIKECILDIDIEEKRIHVHLLEGLRE